MGIRPILNLLHKIEVRRNCSLPRLRVSLFMFFLRSYEIKVSQTFFLSFLVLMYVSDVHLGMQTN